jgi:hypothetical protein
MTVGDRWGVAAARMAWADRDQPAGRVDIWNDGAWVPPEVAAGEEPSPQVAWSFRSRRPSSAAPIAGRRPVGVDVLWGPSIHWNTGAQHLRDAAQQGGLEHVEQGGIYVSFNDHLDAPNGWSTPALGPRRQLVSAGHRPRHRGHRHYAGGVARFFMAGSRNISSFSDAADARRW